MDRMLLLIAIINCLNAIGYVLIAMKSVYLLFYLKNVGA